MAGCPGGNCLRSHVDLIETLSALTMITKAGVPSNKIIVGLTSYGRQFKMTDPSCTHANCTYVGPQSKATPGRCTDVPDYISNAEIKEIIQKNPTAKVFNTGGSSKYMTYDGNWVSYMDDKDKIERTNLWKGMNFGGVVDWAIDLNSFDHDSLIRPPTQLSGVSKSPTSGMRRGGPQLGGTDGIEKVSCYQDDTWKSVDCTTRGIPESARIPPSEAWLDVKGDAAWCATVANWYKVKSDGTSFPKAISDFLNGPDQFRCDALETNNGCSGTLTCLGPEKATGAAMQPLIRSLMNIHGVSDLESCCQRTILK
jgi:hypothetical protein